MPTASRKPKPPAFRSPICARIDWTKIAALVLAPGVPLTHPKPHWTVELAHKAGVPVIGDIELFCRERRRLAQAAPFVAITGTNGKSTTTALTAHLVASAGMDAQLGGNIGTAILSLAPPQAPDIAPTRVHVIECSSYQIDLAPSLDPSIGILINLSEDHLDRHGTMAHYADVKARLVAGVPCGGTAIVGVDDEWCRAIADRLAQSGKPVVRISVRGALADGIYADGPQHPARHCRQGDAASPISAASARCAGCTMRRTPPVPRRRRSRSGLSPAAIQAGLRSFPGLAHRMEEVGRVGNVLFVNDSKATNANSAAQALVCFDDIFWIAGGKPKTGGIESLRGFFPRIRKAYLIGEAAEGIRRDAGRRRNPRNRRHARQGGGAAARDAALSAAPQPVVLLSPACASFDQYRNFEVRGDAFRTLVQALPGLTKPVRDRGSSARVKLSRNAAP